jgi:Ca2+-binding RTX toxin-like protein
MAIIFGTSGDDNYPYGVELRGTNLADEIYGLAGNDSLVGFDGDDLLEGGSGADELWGGYGFDYTSYRGAGAGVEVNLSSGLGVYGDALGDKYHLIEGVIGSAYRDYLYGNDQLNVLRGEGGDDVLHGFGGDDTAHGGGGNDLIGGGAGNDRLDGGDGDDWMDGGYSGDDVLEGGAGVDTASFESAYNSAGVVVDLVSGTADGGGHDLLLGIENLAGSLYDDRLAGNDGANRLDGSFSADVLVGRGGADRFAYDQSYDSTAAAPDVIGDFKRAQGDRIDLSGIDLTEEGGGHEAFQFIGQGPFSGADQVRFFKAGGDTVIELNLTDATAGAEMAIVLDLSLSLKATDFVL